MICQQCETRPATLHFTKIINGEKTEMHVCEQCASENGDTFSFSNQQGLRDAQKQCARCQAM